MATSSKFDISASSPDRPVYNSGQRGPHIASPLDRSGSFRESMDNPILSTLPNMSRSTPSTTQGDLMNFFHCIRFEPKVVAADHKSLRQGDFKRHVNVALGLIPDESPSGSSKGKSTQSPSPEEIKRVKGVLRESGVKARERVKIFNEALSVFNKFFPTMPSKKRSRSESYPGDRSGPPLSGERSGVGPNMGKIVIQNHSIQGSFENEPQKSEERTKTSLPNKRTRTSFVVEAKIDGRNSNLVRPSGTVDRDREMVRIANSGAVQGEDRTLSIGVDGWEKSKMKKKRSGIKPDVSPSTLPGKPVDGYREGKQGMQQRPITDARSRSNNDAHCFRPGVASGIVVGKSDGISQQTGLAIRSSIPKGDGDNSPHMNDKRDRPIASDKERVNVRAVNKANLRDESNSASPISNTKGNPTVRAPRSGSGVLPKSSSVVHKPIVSNDWEIPACTNKPPSGVGSNNRKRMASARSSSPPVAHWAGQRPQKISRTARRSNLVHIVSNNDETHALDSPSDVPGNEIGSGFTKRMSGSSPQQVKIKSEPLCSAALSESEESGAAETKSRDKGKKYDEVDDKGGQSVQKVASLVLSSRKNKLITGEDIGDGVRRQGRTGRGFASARSLTPMTVEKTGNIGTAKQLRSARHGFDKTESKPGRPPTRKLSDRKAYTRQKHSTFSATADFIDDGHDELLTAANAAINPVPGCSPISFWKRMEPFFGFISDSDITYLKQQASLESTPTSTDIPPSIDACNSASTGFGSTHCELMKNNASFLEQLSPNKGDCEEIPLYQRLIAALISEEDYSSGNDLQDETYGSEFDLDEGLRINSFDHQSLNFQFSGPTAYNGHVTFGESEQNQPGTDMMVIDNAMNSNFSRSMNGLFSDQELMSSMTCSEIHYGNMAINEKLLLEIRSIGIFPEPVPDMAQMGDEELGKEIGELETQYHEQVSRRKVLLDGILKSASSTKELQEKDFEPCALEKLTTIAYEKYIGCWGPNTSGKSSSNKAAKQAALAFVKRTLEHCHNYEDTGKSCFSEPLFKDIFRSRSNINNTQQADSTPDGESSKGYTSIRYLEGKMSASLGSQQSPSPFSQSVDNHDGFLDSLMSEQTSGKEDAWSSRVKKKELSLDDVGYNIGMGSGPPSGMGTPLSSSAKGKRSERDRDGKGHNRESASRNGTAKLGRPSLNNAKGERKKSKPKQKISQLSVSVNGLLGKISEPPKPTVSKSNEMTSTSNAKEKDGFGLDVLDDPDAFDLSHLQLPGMDVLGVSDDIDGQGQDLGSWLNIDDEGLQDHDFMGGLEIPMDDLSDLNMTV